MLEHPRRQVLDPDRHPALRDAGAPLEKAAGIGGDQDLGAGARERVELRREELAAHRGMVDVVDAGGAAAEVLELHAHETVAVEASEELVRRADLSDRVLQVAGRVPGHALAAGSE